ncbi:MAG TPA: 50S ribosomal protein L24 [Spirochaetota bacterium]|nr:50S ribosomal protein L24 [Spirochaetota bacterium]HPP03271.1 50S ribosomal protein L24 [Spirochaetota bacterium]
MIKFKKIKKQDNVEVIAGKEKGKTGKVIDVDRNKGRVLIEGINIVKKAMRKTKENPQGGIKEIEAFINISNVMLICPKCSKKTRVGFKIKRDEKEGEKRVRICKKCKAEID